MRDSRHLAFLVVLWRVFFLKSCPMKSTTFQVVLDYLLTHACTLTAPKPSQSLFITKANMYKYYFLTDPSKQYLQLISYSFFLKKEGNYCVCLCWFLDDTEHTSILIKIQLFWCLGIYQVPMYHCRGRILVKPGQPLCNTADQRTHV